MFNESFTIVVERKIGQKERNNIIFVTIKIHTLF